MTEFDPKQSLLDVTRYDLPADAVARYDGDAMDAVGGHEMAPAFSNPMSK